VRELRDVDWLLNLDFEALSAAVKELLIHFHEQLQSIVDQSVYRPATQPLHLFQFRYVFRRVRLWPSTDPATEAWGALSAPHWGHPAANAFLCTSSSKITAGGDDFGYFYAMLAVSNELENSVEGEAEIWLHACQDTINPPPLS